VLLALAALAAAPGCSGGDDAATTTTAASATAGLTTVAPSTGPIVTTTTIGGTPVSDAEIYAQAGLDPTQSACVEQSGVDGEFAATPGPTPLDALVLTADDGRMVAIPPTVRTGTELQQLMLDTFAANCAPHDLLAALAALDGAAMDSSALADDLPARLLRRRTEGATPAELTCIEAGFRAAPVRLASLGADPRAIESGCARGERRATWRRTALENGLRTAGATDAERTCLASTTGDRALLAAAVDAVAQGESPAGSAAGEPDVTPACVSMDRLQQLALDIVARGADFGAETLAPS
jgi:hypothetical protein